MMKMVKRMVGAAALMFTGYVLLSGIANAVNESVLNADPSKRPVKG